MSAPVPHGVCFGCGDLTCLPPFGGGMCFLCATDGPPGNHTPAIGAVGEDQDARRRFPDLTDKDEERRVEILEEFAGHQATWARAIGSAYYRSQRLETWTTPARRARDVDNEPTGPTDSELRARVRRRQRDEERRRRAVSHKERIEARLAAPGAYAERVIEVRGKRSGGGNYASPLRVQRAIELRRSGFSLRAIAKETGLSKATVQQYVPWIPRPEAMRQMHVRLKAEGRPILPPWAPDHADQQRRNAAAKEASAHPMGAREQLDREVEEERARRATRARAGEDEAGCVHSKPRSTTHTIKRYPNRKLYDPICARYVTLRDIAGLVQSGVDVNVIDSDAGADITMDTFAKMIAREDAA